MTLKSTYKSKAQLTPVNWSGGTTTELFIGPEGANYAQRQFDIRVSSAKVELEASQFTALPGVDRHLMVLEGVLEVDHVGHHSVCLAPFETDSFSGDWETHSRGQVTDFNLMLKRGMKGMMDYVELQKDRAAIIECNYVQLALFYCYKGSVALAVYQNESLIESMTLSQGDVYYFEDLYGTAEIEMTSTQGEPLADVIYCEVYLA